MLKILVSSSLSFLPPSPSANTFYLPIGQGSQTTSGLEVCMVTLVPGRKPTLAMIPDVDCLLWAIGRDPNSRSLNLNKLVRWLRCSWPLLVALCFPPPDPQNCGRFFFGFLSLYSIYPIAASLKLKEKIFPFYSHHPTVDPAASNLAVQPFPEASSSLHSSFLLWYLSLWSPVPY